MHEQYHSISTKFVEDKSYTDEQGPTHWSTQRFDQIISLRESALNYARELWADYFLVSFIYVLTFNNSNFNSETIFT